MKREWIENLLIAFAMVIFLSLNGCAQMFTAKTKARYEIRPDGTKIVEYESDKEQIGMDAKFGDVHVKVDKASTQDAVIAAVLSMQGQVLQLLRDQASKGAGS